MPQPIVIAAYYKFVRLPDFRDMREPLLALCRGAGIRGTILLAEEGINATIAGPRAAIDRVIASLRSDARLADIRVKKSLHGEMPFGKLKVRLKREIVALKQPNIDPNLRAGEYIEPAAWNALISQPDVALIDARNAYEIAIGSFPKAINPGTGAYHELPGFLNEQLDPARHKRIAMFCTGGIRCEKASAYLLQRGFDQVYQLRGGILAYLEDLPPAESLWQGECFVFDERVSLDHSLRKGKTRICDDCKGLLGEDLPRCPACGSLNLL